jgi:integrase/recombinase XerD
VGDVQLRSVLAGQIAEFLAEKRSTGCTYGREEAALRALDRYLCRIGHPTSSLSREAVEGWVHGQPHQCPKTQQYYVGLIRQFALFLVRTGFDAHVSEKLRTPVVHTNLAARVFTHDEIKRLLAAVDRLAPDGRARSRGPVVGTRRQLAFPVLFRVLYGCGLRCGEALRLVTGDVDLDAGILLIRQGKFRQDRLVPVSRSLLKCLRAYSSSFGPRPSDAPFFPAPGGGIYSLGNIYHFFRRALWVAGIPHHGRRHGPRVHDLRHAYAVHRLEAWHCEGADLGVKLPVLATYMGHQGLAGTQRYLRLTAALFPDVSRTLDAAYGRLVPRGPTP